VLQFLVGLRAQQRHLLQQLALLSLHLSALLLKLFNDLHVFFDPFLKGLLLHLHVLQFLVGLRAQQRHLLQQLALLSLHLLALLLKLFNDLLLISIQLHLQVTQRRLQSPLVLCGLLQRSALLLEDCLPTAFQVHLGRLRFFHVTAAPLPFRQERLLLLRQLLFQLQICGLDTGDLSLQLGQGLLVTEPHLACSGNFRFDRRQFLSQLVTVASRLSQLFLQTASAFFGHAQVLFQLLFATAKGHPEASQEVIGFLSPPRATWQTRLPGPCSGPNGDETSHRKAPWRPWSPC